MAENEKLDIRVAGDGAVGGGTYGEVTINGAGSISGEITCTRLRINGAGNCRGAVTADFATVNGSGTFGGQLQAGELTVNGDASVAGAAGIGSLKVNGRMSVGGSAAVRDADVKGELVVGGDVEAESLTAEGALRVGGLLKAGRVDVTLHGSAQAREIRGDSVRVALARRFAPMSLFALFVEKRLAVDAVEADDVFLEATTARLVRGARVRLGEGARVERVEYGESLARESDAQVAEEVKV